MIVLLQRVSSAHATRKEPSRDRLASIGPGLVIFTAVLGTDDTNLVSKMVEKIVNLRIFTDEQGKMNRSAATAQASLLWVSQFTLLADCTRGHRPSFVKAGDRNRAEAIYHSVRETIERLFPGLNSHFTPFGCDLEVQLVNDGPVTIWLDSDSLFSQARID